MNAADVTPGRAPDLSRDPPPRSHFGLSRRTNSFSPQVSDESD